MKAIEKIFLICDYAAQCSPNFLSFSLRMKAKHGWSYIEMKATDNYLKSLNP